MSGFTAVGPEVYGDLKMALVLAILILFLRIPFGRGKSAVADIVTLACSFVVSVTSAALSICWFRDNILRQQYPDWGVLLIAVSGAIWVMLCTIALSTWTAAAAHNATCYDDGER